MTAELTRLAGRLGVDEQRLAAFASYDGADLARLDAAVERAMTAEDHAFEEALEKALGFVPRLLRGTAQKLLHQGGHRG